MKVAIIAVLLSMVSGVPALAGTFVYVSNAEDGDIGMYTLQPDGSLHAGPRFKAEKIVMPMTVNPDKRFLVAAVRSKPYQAYSDSIDPGSGALKLIGQGRSPKASLTSRLIVAAAFSSARLTAQTS
jgi:6-phosphogluconolactonase